MSAVIQEALRAVRHRFGRRVVVDRYHARALVSRREVVMAVERKMSSTQEPRKIRLRE